MPLQQLNLKLPPAVLADWRQRATAEGLSIRDWLVAALAPAAPPAPTAAAPAPDGLLARVEALEAAVARLEAAPRRSPRPAPAVAPSPPPPAPVPLVPVAAPADAIETGELAQRLGLRRKTLNERIRRAGGIRVGLELQGWCCSGMARPALGGPPRALWVPVEVPG